MATNNRDINFVIRARNEAGKAFDSVNKALDELARNQEEISASTGKVGSVLDAFARIATTVGTAYNKLSGDAESAAAAFSRQEARLNETKAAYQSLAVQMEAAQRVQQRMASFVGPMPKGSEKQLGLVEKAYKQLSDQSVKLVNSIASQEDAVRKSHYSLVEISGTAEKAAEALRKVEAAQRSAGDAAAKAAAQQEKERLALERTAQTAQRKSALETRRDMSGLSAGAQASWKESENDIKALREEIRKSGEETAAQAAQFANLTAKAAANKQAYRELQIAIAQYNQVLRTQGASQDQIAAAQQRAQSAMQAARATMVNIGSAANQAANGIRNQGKASEEAAKSNRRLNQEMTSLFANSRRSLSYFQRVRGEVLALITSYAGLYAAIQGVNNVIQSAMTMQGIESRLNVVTGGDMTKTGDEFRWVREEADRLGFSMQTLGTEWSKFAVSAEASNFSLEDTRKIFTSVAEAGRVLKLDSQRISQTFVALTQMMSKGTIQMEELRQQLGEHIPGAFAMMAKAAGVSGAELTKMMEKGELTSDYLLKFADVLDQRFGGQLTKSLTMVQAEMGRFQTAVQAGLNSIAEAGTLEAFSQALRELQEYLNSDAAQVWFERIGAAISALIKMLMGVLDNLDLIAIAFVGLGAAKGVAAVLRLVDGFRKMRTDIAAATTAARGLSAATAVLGGLPGIAIGAAVSAFAMLATRISETERSMVSAEKTIDRVSAAYRRGAKSAEAWTKALESTSITQTERDLANLRAALDRELKNITQPFGRSYMARVGMSDSPFKGVIQEIHDATAAVRKGELSIADYRKRLDEIAQEYPQFKELATTLMDQASAAEEGETRVNELAATLRLMRGEATEADKALLGLAEATDDLSEAQLKGVGAMEDYLAAMKDLKELVPELKKEMEFQATFDKISQRLQASYDSIAKGEASGEIAPELAVKLRQEAMDVAARATQNLYKGMEEGLIRDFARGQGDLLQQSVALLQRFEGFQPTGTWDVNAYRAGFGSDTVTLADGSIQKITKGMSVTREDGLRDLVRRIGEFQTIVKSQVGSERWSVLSTEQQAALTSVAYNYGSLPKRILEAVRTGTSEEMAAAVRGLRDDNGGINAARRDQEAAILGQRNVGLEVAMQEKEAELAKRYNDLVASSNKELDHRIAKLDLSKLQAEIYNETTAKGINLQSAEGQAIAAKVTKLWEAEQALKAGEEAEKRVNDLLALRKEIQDQIEFQQSQGNFEASDLLTEKLDGINARLREAIDNAVAMWTALGGPESELALARLDGIKNSITDTSRVTLDAKSINQSFASGAANAFDKMGASLADFFSGAKSGKEVFKDIGQAFLQFAADFLRQIAQMILQQIIFNAVSGMFGGGGGGLGGMIAGIVRHNGGLANGSGTTRAISPAWYTNAVRYHSGGIAGLKPNEVPAILERNEEILTRDDPRHILNGGGAAGGQSSPTNLKIVNAIDAASVLEQAVTSREGEQVFMNFIRANRGAVKSAIG